MELRAMHRKLTDRAVEIHVGNALPALILVHQIVEAGRFAVRFDDPRLYHDICPARLLTGHLQLLARVSVELIGVSGCNIIPECRNQLLLLGGVEACLRRADGEPGHYRDVECPVNNRREPGKSPAFAEHATLLHIAG